MVGRLFTPFAFAKVACLFRSESPGSSKRPMPNYYHWRRSSANTPLACLMNRKIRCSRPRSITTSRHAVRGKEPVWTLGSTTAGQSRNRILDERRPRVLGQFRRRRNEERGHEIHGPIDPDYHGETIRRLAEDLRGERIRTGTAVTQPRHGNDVGWFACNLDYSHDDNQNDRLIPCEAPSPDRSPLPVWPARGLPSPRPQRAPTARR